MQLKPPRTRTMASLQNEELATHTRAISGNCNTGNNSNNYANHLDNNHNVGPSDTAASSGNLHALADEGGASGKRESLEARKQNLELRLSEKSWLLQQIQKHEAAIIHGNYEHMTINEFFAQLAQQYKHEQQLGKDNNNGSALLRRKQSTSSNISNSNITNNNNNNHNHNNNNNNNNNNNINNNRHSETHSNRSSEYDNYQPAGGGGGGMGDMLVIGVAQQQSQQHPHVKSALKKRPTPTPTAHIQMQYAAQTAQRQQLPQQQQQHQQQHLLLHHMDAFAYQQQQRTQTDVISMYSANSSNVATLRQQHVAPQQQPIIVQCDKYYLSPTHQSYNEGGFIKSSQNIKKYVSPLASPSAISYEQSSLQHQQHQRQLDAISLAPSYMSVEMESVQQHQQQQYRWRSQSHIAALTPPHPHQQQTPNQSINAAMAAETKSHSSDMLAAPLQRYKPLDEISLCSTSIEKKPKSKQWLESSLDGPAVVRQIESSAHSPVSSNGSSAAAAAASAAAAGKPRIKLSSQSMSVSGRHYSMSAQRGTHNYAPAGYVAAGNAKALQHADERFAKLSQSTSYLNAMEQTVGISTSYALEPLDIPPFRHLPPKPNHSQQPTPPPRPPPASNNINNNNNSPNVNNNLSSALVSPPLTVATATVAAAASLSPEIRIESPKNMTVVQQATFQPYKEVTKPFEMSDFYKYSTKFKQKEGGRPE
ncbi:hypothetical protein KR044_004414 [Drosophila immigrans]|nr:hypothetical protein KR044_004414 [Drosophila immigrans]